MDKVLNFIKLSLQQLKFYSMEDCIIENGLYCTEDGKEMVYVMAFAKIISNNKELDGIICRIVKNDSFVIYTKTKFLSMYVRKYSPS